eukprot:767147-Hanusia_phi.AAC.4
MSFPGLTLEICRYAAARPLPKERRRTCIALLGAPVEHQLSLCNIIQRRYFSFSSSSSVQGEHGFAMFQPIVIMHAVLQQPEIEGWGFLVFSSCRSSREGCFLEAIEHSAGAVDTRQVRYTRDRSKTRLFTSVRLQKLCPFGSKEANIAAKELSSQGVPEAGGGSRLRGGGLLLSKPGSDASNAETPMGSRFSEPFVQACR